MGNMSLVIGLIHVRGPHGKVFRLICSSKVTLGPSTCTHCSNSTILLYNNLILKTGLAPSSANITPRQGILAHSSFTEPHGKLLYSVLYCTLADGSHLQTLSPVF